MRILFQGDSITDAGRDKRNYHELGHGYANYAAEKLRVAYPDAELEFINLGIAGNRTSQLFDRLYADAIKFQPDVVSVMVGINDMWHRHTHKILTSDEQFALNYRSILNRLKHETGAKIVMIAPYLLDAEDKEEIREDMKTILPIIRDLAKEFADVYIPLDERFAEALKTQPEPKYYSADGIHPNANGAAFIGELYIEAVKPLIESL
ncbi:MAG: SGNH/GDSL hydrolase family protein [Clostridia bacterium]|nr:SGNH/GDSL hydrolase family protein [Clostridia bacterium]